MTTSTTIKDINKDIDIKKNIKYLFLIRKRYLFCSRDMANMIIYHMIRSSDNDQFILWSFISMNHREWVSSFIEEKKINIALMELSEVWNIVTIASNSNSVNAFCPFLERGIDIHISGYAHPYCHKRSDIISLLSHALFINHQEFIKLLSIASGDIEELYQHVIADCNKREDSIKLKQILNNNGTIPFDKNIGLDHSLNIRSFKMFKFWAENGADIYHSDFTGFLDSLRYRVLEILDYLLERGKEKGETIFSEIIKSMFLNAYKRDRKTVKILESKGFEIPHWDNEFVMKIFKSSGPESMRKFLKRGVVDPICLHMGLLHMISNRKYPQINILLDHGADVHFQDDQPLMLAVGHDTYTVSLILKNGGNVHARDGEAFKIATNLGNLDIVALLQSYMKTSKPCSSL